MSGIRAQIAVKVFGPDLRELRTAAYDIQSLMQGISGVVDLQIEPQVEISQLQMRVKREEASRYGLALGTLLKSWRQRSRDAWFLRCSKKTNSSVLSCGMTKRRGAIRMSFRRRFSRLHLEPRSRSRKLLKSWILQDQMFSIGSMSSVVSRCSAMCKVVIWQASLATSKWPATDRTVVARFAW